MKIKKNVEVPPEGRGGNKYSKLFESVIDFNNNDDEVSMCIECESPREARAIAGCMRNRVKRAELPVKVFLRGQDVYLTKEKKDA